MANTLFISEYAQYALIKRDVSRYRKAHNRFVTTIVDGETLPRFVDKNTVYIDEVNTYEIYTQNPDTLEGGWDIKFILSCDLCIKKFPLFDCIISKNDCPLTHAELESFFDYNSNKA